MFILRGAGVKPLRGDIAPTPSFTHQNLLDKALEYSSGSLIALNGKNCLGKVGKGEAVRLSWFWVPS